MIEIQISIIVILYLYIGYIFCVGIEKYRKTQYSVFVEVLTELVVLTCWPMLFFFAHYLKREKNAK
jgi:hypothetical protein